MWMSISQGLDCLIGQVERAFQRVLFWIYRHFRQYFTVLRGISDSTVLAKHAFQYLLGLKGFSVSTVQV